MARVGITRNLFCDFRNKVGQTLFMNRLGPVGYLRKAGEFPFPRSGSMQYMVGVNLLNLRQIVSNKRSDFQGSVSIKPKLNSLTSPRITQSDDAIENQGICFGVPRIETEIAKPFELIGCSGFSIYQIGFQPGLREDLHRVGIEVEQEVLVWVITSRCGLGE